MEQVLLNLWGQLFGQEKIRAAGLISLNWEAIPLPQPAPAGVDQLFGTKMPLPLFDKLSHRPGYAGFIKARRATRFTSPEQISPYCRGEKP